MKAAAAPRVRCPTRAWTMAISGASPDKVRMAQAESELDWTEFDNAIKTEVNALWSNKTCKLVTRRRGMKITPTTMPCERKRRVTGKIERYKARFVVRGDKPVYIVDYLQSFAHVARHTTQRVLLAVTLANGMVIAQLDIETAFLTRIVNEIIYVQQPRGYKRGDKAMVCQLINALDSLKQAARQWHIKRAGVLKPDGFEPSDPCRFKGTRDGKQVSILLLVNDLLMVAERQQQRKRESRARSESFNARKMGEWTYFLKLHDDRDREKKTIKLGQRQYVINLLERFGMSGANSARLL